MGELKSIVKSTSLKLFTLAEDSLKQNHNLERVILVKRPFRCDFNDHTGLKAKLSEYGNRVFEDIWLDKGCPKNILIVQQFLECDGYVKVQRFGSPTNEGYDGIHFKGKLGVQHFTRSFLNILLDSLPNRVSPNHLQFGSSQGQESYTNVVRKNIEVQV